MSSTCSLSTQTADPAGARATPSCRAARSYAGLSLTSSQHRLRACEDSKAQMPPRTVRNLGRWGDRNELPPATQVTTGCSFRALIWGRKGLWLQGNCGSLAGCLELHGTDRTSLQMAPSFKFFSFNKDF